MHAYRSHSCADLNLSNKGDTVRLAGWVHRVRDHGGVLFIDSARPLRHDAGAVRPRQPRCCKDIGKGPVGMVHPHRRRRSRRATQRW